MRLKSFHAPTMTEAMRQVRTALGDDAIIVATREEEGGVRVTAAIDDAPPAAAPLAARPRPAIVTPRPPEIDVAEVLTDVLRRQGTPHALTDRLVDLAASFDTNDPQLALAAALDSLFTFQPLPETRTAKPIMLIGPPGAGKTLAVAKLAARATLKGRPVGVVSTDTVRAGGIEQLSAFTRLLKLQLIAVEDALALSDALTVLNGVEQVLIDSAGRNPFDPDDMEDLANLLAAADVEPVLVLPGGSDPLEAIDMAASFREMGARRLLLTRLDMTRRLGGMLAVAHEAKLSFCDASTASKVAEGMTPLTPVALTRLILPAAQPAPQAAKQTGTFS